MAVVAKAPAGLERFAKLGIRSEPDLLLHLPLRYEDETRITPIARVHPGENHQIQGEILRAEVSGRGRRMLNVEVGDDSGRLALRFLHFYGSQVAQLVPGRTVRAVGEIRGGLFGLEIVHPRYRIVEPDAPLPTRLTPVYPTAAGIGQAMLRAAILRALAAARWPETVPAPILARLGLPGLLESLRRLHEPPPGEPLDAIEARNDPAWRRVIFDELLAQQLSLKRARDLRAGQSGIPLVDRSAPERLAAALPFRLTGAQQRAWSEIAADLERKIPMNRLLQGDVGSGKTVIAALAAMKAVGSGRQAALMAPTEILAEQHHRKLTGWLEPLGIRCAWLAGSLKESGKRGVRAAVAAGEVDLLVGTHALIEETVEIPRLGLAIVDEQHRFGVAQRLALRASRGHALPHQLMMSATPIPRTLAMSYYADLDVSVIDELPPGRQPVTTKLIAEARRDEVIAGVRAAASAGRQAYWVCPLIEESGESADRRATRPDARGASRGARRQREALELQTAIDTHRVLEQELAGLRIGLVHGRLPPPEKAATMEAFSAGAIDVLVATTVIEVGVDVPNASLMVIEHAERFGLSQLHQLRGRVGRGSDRSVCILMYRAPLSPSARERLKTMYETSDGFEIARRDLALRGPGEFLGARQSGLALLRFADLERDSDLVEAARDAAAEMLAGAPALADAHLERWLSGREDYLKA